MPEIFSDSALKAQVEKLQQDLPKQEGHIGVVAAAGDVGVEGELQAATGHGTFVAAQGSWMQRAGYRVAAVFGWKGKS